MDLKILADAMGLGKTIMTIALLACSTRAVEVSEVRSTSEVSVNLRKKAVKFPGFDKLMKKKKSIVDGGSLIICPMTLLGQWKVLVLFWLFMLVILY